MVLLCLISPGIEAELIKKKKYKERSQFANDNQAGGQGLIDWGSVQHYTFLVSDDPNNKIRP